MKQKIHYILIVVDRYLQLMGDKFIPEFFYPPFIAGIDIPHQGIVDSYNLHCYSTGNTAVLQWAIDICLYVFGVIS